MMLPRFLVLAGVLLAIGVYWPMRATVAAVAVPVASAFDSGVTEKKDDGDVPRPRPTPGPRDQMARLVGFHFETSEQKKAEAPPRPRPKPGPKEGGEDD